MLMIYYNISDLHHGAGRGSTPGSPMDGIPVNCVHQTGCGAFEGLWPWMYMKFCSPSLSKSRQQNDDKLKPI